MLNWGIRIRKSGRRSWANAPPPVFTALPSITPTSGGQGTVYTCTPGVISGGALTLRQWFRDGAPIGGANSLTYVAAAGDETKFIDCRETAVGLGGSVVGISNAAFVETYSPILGPYDFAGADGTLLSTIGWTVDGGAASEWSKFTLQSNAGRVANAVQSGSPSSRPIAHRDTGFTGQSIRADILASSTAWGLVVARLDSSNFVWVDYGGPTSMNIRSKIGGTEALIANLGSGISNANGPCTVKIVNDLKKIKVYFNGVQVGAAGGYTLPAALESATRAGFCSHVGTTNFDNVTIEGLAQPEFALVSVTANSFNTGIQLIVSGIYNGAAPTNMDFQIEDNTGAVISAWAAANAGGTISAGNFTLTLSQQISTATYSNKQIRVRARKTGTTTPVRGLPYNVPDLPAVAPMILGINEDTMNFTDLGSFFNVRNPADYDINILERGAKNIPVAGKNQILASATGAGATVKRDWDGSIYGTNGAGLTEYRFVWDIFIPASQGGTYTLQLGAGVVIPAAPNLAGGSGWSYNSVTGVGTLTVTGGVNLLLDFRVTCASLPAGGCRPILRCNSAPAGNFWNTTSNSANIATVCRYMGINGTNYDRLEEKRTDLAQPVRLPADRKLSGATREKCTEHCNLVGAHMWWNVRMFDGDALLADDAAYFAATLAVDKTLYVELGNEWWNIIFPGYNDYRLAGLRRGYAPLGATPGTAVPETIYDAIYGDLIDRPTNATKVAFLAGEKVFWDQNGGTRVYQANSDQAIGSVMPAGTSNAGWTVIYDNTDAVRAGERWRSSRTKEIRAIFDAAFSAVGRARPVYVLGTQAAGSFSTQVQQALDWDNGHLTFDAVAFAHYYGGGVGGKDLGRYNQSSTWITGWTVTEHEALYTTANAATAITNAKNAYFSASRACIDAALSIIPAQKQQLADYCKGKGIDKNAIRMVQYECNWHTIFGGVGGWPDNAAARSTTTAYTAGALAKEGGEIFKCILGHTNQPCSNATYWTKIATAAIAAESPNRMTQLYASIYLDSRHADDLTHYLQGLQRVHGGECMLFSRKAVITPNGTWCVMEHEDDVGAGNFRNTALKTFKASL